MERVSKQLILSTQSGRLKPDVRLGVAVSEFAQTLDDDRKREFQKMQTAGTQLSGRDAIRVTEELNRDSEWRHSAWRPYGTNCGKFLDRLQTLANIGDVMIGGSQNVIATSIWCAVRLALQTATNYRGYFERLSSLFLKLGTSWDLHNDFAQIFPQSQALQTFLCEYLIVLMRLCRKTVAFSNKSFAGQVWSSLGASFDSEFKPLQEEMDKWGLMIQHKTQQLATVCVVDSEMFRRKDYKQRMLRLLSPNQSQHVTTWRRHRRKGDCKWIYQTEAYTSWLAEDASSTLCISGKLGSGKTVTMANIVAQINMHQPCAFFFSTFKEPESLKATTVLGSIAFHLLDSIPGDDSTWDVLARQEDTTSRVLTSTGIIHLLADLLPEHSKYVLVFDGLEDCPNDEITEVIHGLRRLMACRRVLLCYSARSGSMFQRLTVQKLAAKFSLTLDGKMHDEAIEAYITKELARRIQSSQTGLFSHRVEELVKKQLIAGAQGMFLWVTLQLDSIFPSHSRTVVTHEQILNLIYNLPKDLPEAFERALQEIIDGRYGDSIMKIVMAAQSPLTLDELRVALTVVPGDPVWYAAKTPADANQLIALCGGSLLELDEEDGKVRFIHYSVVNHLHQTTTNPRTALYHSSPEEADILVGAICVTFLNTPIFDTDVAATNKITGEQLAEKVIGTASHQNPFLTHLAHHFMKRNRHQPTSTDFDIGRLMAEIQAASTARFDPHCFQGYAMSNWLSHSGAFSREDPLCMKVWHLWLSLLWGHIKVATIPFQSPVEGSWPALSWALMNHHKPLVYAIFDEPTTEPTDGEEISQGIAELTLSTPAKKCDPFSLGLILAHLFQSIVDTLRLGPKHKGDHSIVDDDSTSGPEVLSNLLYRSQQLLDLGADPTIPHTRNGNTILKMLLEILGSIPDTDYVGLQSYSLLMRVLAYRDPQPSLQSAWVPYSLRRILELGNTRSFVKLLSYRPKVHIPPKEDSLIGVAIVQGNDVAVKALVNAWPEGGLTLAEASYIYGQPAIQLALEKEDKKMVELLAIHGGLSTRSGITQFSAPLLRVALRRMSVWWVELLLQLGAAPNLGYQASIDEPTSHTGSRYHLQDVAMRNQTLRFLTLVRYGADARLPGFLTIRSIVTNHDNRVLMARLKEMELIGSTKCSGTFEVGSRAEVPRSSALLEACKMIAADVNENQTFKYFGLTESPHNFGDLQLILLALVNSTRADQLNIQCRQGNTALHYLAGATDWFRREAHIVASHLLTSERALPALNLRNENGQTPLHCAIDKGSKNNWLPPYIDSIVYLSSYIRAENSLSGRSTGDDGGALAFAISKDAPIDDVTRVLLRAGSDPNGTWKGVTALDIAGKIRFFPYRSLLMSCLVSYGADQSVAYSNTAPLLDVMTTGCQIQIQDSSQSFSNTSTKAVRGGVEAAPLCGLEDIPIYELEDTSARRLMSLEAQKSGIPPRFWIPLSVYQILKWDAYLEQINTSLRIEVGGAEGFFAIEKSRGSD